MKLLVAILLKWGNTFPCSHLVALGCQRKVIVVSLCLPLLSKLMEEKDPVAKDFHRRTGACVGCHSHSEKILAALGRKVLEKLEDGDIKGAN